MTAQSFEVLIDTSVKNSEGEPIDEFLAGTEWIGRVVDNWVVITLHNGDIGFLPLSATTLAAAPSSLLDPDNGSGSAGDTSFEVHLSDADLGIRPEASRVTERPRPHSDPIPAKPVSAMGWPDPEGPRPFGSQAPRGDLGHSGVASPSPATTAPWATTASPIPTAPTDPESTAHDPTQPLDADGDLMGQPLMRFGAIVTMIWAAYTLLRGRQEYRAYDVLGQFQESTFDKVSVSPIMLPIPRSLFEHSWLYYNNGSPLWSPFCALTGLCLLAALLAMVKMSMGTVRFLTVSLWLHLLLTSYLILGTLIDLREFNPSLPVGAGISAAAWAAAVPFAVTIMARPYIRSVQLRQREHALASYSA